MTGGIMRLTSTSWLATPTARPSPAAAAAVRAPVLAAASAKTSDQTRAAV